LLLLVGSYLHDFDQATTIKLHAAAANSSNRNLGTRQRAWQMIQTSVSERKQQRLEEQRKLATLVRHQGLLNQLVFWQQAKVQGKAEPTKVPSTILEEILRPRLHEYLCTHDVIVAVLVADVRTQLEALDVGCNLHRLSDIDKRHTRNQVSALIRRVLGHSTMTVEQEFERECTGVHQDTRVIVSAFIADKRASAAALLAEASAVLPPVVMSLVIAFVPVMHDEPGCCACAARSLSIPRTPSIKRI
jgi:hypothetical protein